MNQVTIVTGSAGAGKTGRILDEYRVALEQARTDRRPGTTLWLAPTRRIQRAVTQQVLASCGSVCFAVNVLTFDQFAEKILEAAGRPASPISPVIKRLMLRRIAESLLKQGQLRHFQSIARTTGFLDVVSNFISELKREEIWPEQFVAACEQRTSAFARRDLELGLIYTDYQKHLTEQNWYDNEGRFWLARTALAEGKRSPFEAVKMLAVDGFADFTQTQYEILGYLAGWIERVSISLPLEDPVTRSDLFAKPQAAAARLRECFSDPATIQIVRLPSKSANHSSSIQSGWADAIPVAADRLFSNPRFVQPTSDAEGLEIIAATGPFGEWEAVARRIKTLLAEKTDATDVVSTKSPPSDVTKPQEIVIGLRSISDDGPRLRNYLAAAGLPVWCEAESPFISSSIVKAIVSVLNLELENWPFERLLGVLDSNFFRPNWPELAEGRGVRAVATSLRRLQINSGRDLILKALARYATDSESAFAATNKSLKELARIASPLLGRLSRSLDRLRRSHTLVDWADVMASIADDLGWPKPRTSSSDRLAATESRDLDLFQRILRTAAEADQAMTGSARPRLLSLSEFTSELRDLLSHETVNSELEHSGCIRILGVEQIRNLEIPHLFLIGLTESSFPMNRADDCLLSESERQDFISRGIRLGHRSEQHSDEMLLFYSIVTRARRSLTLSYPAINGKGQPVFPSPYVTALTSLFIPGSFASRKEGQLDPVPSTQSALSFTDLRLAAMVEARQGQPELFRAVLELEPLRRSGLNSLAACEVADHRFHQRGFTKYEGQLESFKNLSRLRQRFGSHHQFSATELEAYAKCPFQFWLSNVLKIDAIESTEEGTDYSGRGTLLHEVLANLLTEGALADPNVLQTRFREIMNAQLDRHVPETEFRQALIKVERLILSRWAEAFVGQQSEFDQKIGELLQTTQSLAPEIPFGKLPDAPVADPRAHPPIRFGDDERSVNLRGRIDRVDVGSLDGHPAFVVVDYKTGQRPSTRIDDLTSGRSIQLGLYLLAIKRLGLVGDDAIPLQMGYWALHDTGFKHGLGGAKFKQIEPTEIQWLETLLDGLLPQLAEEIRSGRFVVENHDPNCTGRCPYRTVCRVNQLRPLAQSLGKQSPARTNPSEIGETDKIE